MEPKNQTDLKERRRARRTLSSKAEKKSETAPAAPAFAKEGSLLKKRGFFSRYRSFRRGGLSVVDSFFNSFYILLSEKSVEKEKRKLDRSGMEVHSRHFLELHAPSLRFFSSLAKRLRGLLNTSVRKKDQSHAHLSKARLITSHLPQIAVVTLGLALALYIAVTSGVPVVLRAEIGGQVIGVVEDKYTVDSAIDELEDNATAVLGKSFTFPYEIRYTFERQRADALTPKSEISAQLYTYVQNSICTAAGLYVDDVLVAVAENEAAVQRAIDDFCARHHDGKTSGIFNDIRIVTQAYPTETVIPEENVLALLEEMNLPLDERERNPAEESPILPGTEEGSPVVEGLLSDVRADRAPLVGLSSRYPASIDGIKLNFYTAEEESYETVVPYETVYVESAEHYTCMADASVRGSDGLSRVTARIYYVDGKEARREILEEDVIREPVDQVVSIGTKLLPEELGVTSFDSAPGRFIVPRVGFVFSYYGYREDGFHKGWDIPGDEGDNLYAAASGTVVVAIGQDGYFSNRPEHHYAGYGYCVVIQHEDGYSTMYAHCNRINVTLGQKVKQGDKIAEVGNTGKSEGNHVHFEILKDDVAQDPARYLYTGTQTIYDQNKR
ncbi:MAG: peptidoglycan DD-metalloendopeptidase family protein [Clostridia bacterium]|nr:peptidoglycan DD-metalloendopeptidase family protein [Clostridia bacterium]